MSIQTGTLLGGSQINFRADKRIACILTQILAPCGTIPNATVNGGDTLLNLNRVSNKGAILVEEDALNNASHSLSAPLEEERDGQAIRILGE